MIKIITTIRQTAETFAKPIILFYALPWLMILLILGTVAQRYIGLYQSQKLFFGSFIFWVGPLPSPGAYTTLSIIVFSLCAKLLLKSPLKKHRVGTIIAHASILLLLAGGLVTALSREEGYMVLDNNETSNSVSDYHDREFVVIRNDKLVLRIPHTKLYAGKKISDNDLPFSLSIENYCFQCKVLEHSAANNAHGLADKFNIEAAPADKEDEKNQSGVIFSIEGADNNINGTYLTYQPLNQQPSFSIGKNKYQILIRQSERKIPFELRLLQFNKSEYPGTNIARSYASLVEVIDGALKWNTVIQMNQPLRYRGYTIYQSSFIESDGRLSTVLAVVKNAGDIFPYLAISALCIGLVIHLASILMRKKSA